MTREEVVEELKSIQYQFQSSLEEAYADCLEIIDKYRAESEDKGDE